MRKGSAENPQRLKEGGLTASTFDQLLKWLDEDKDSEGQRYLEMRRRLAGYFDRKGCLNPDELADETLNRVARRLAEEGHIETETPAKYCYITARFVFMEHLRGSQKHNTLLDGLRRQTQTAGFGESDQVETRERMLECLDRCIGELETSNREIILRYYSGRERVKIENRRALAQSLGITMNALSIRACRIRDRLEACVQQCVDD
jgi:DNA-directed RNA polymerase specialized sigma24 family protein